MVPSRSRKTAGRRVEGSGRRHLGEFCVKGRFDHGGSDGGHAAMIGGAAAEEAGAAVGLLLNDGEARGDGCGAFGIGGAENGDYWETDGCGDVHGAGIVAEEEVTLREERGEIGDGRFAGEVDGGTLEFGGDGGGDGKFTGGAEEDHVGVGVRKVSVQGFGEAIGGPAFGGAVGGSSTDGDARGMRAGACFEQDLRGALAARIRDAKGDVRFVGELIEPICATEEFEVVKLFVGRNFTGLGGGDSFGEKKRAGVAGVADALGNLCAPGEPGSVKGVLQEEGDVEFAGAKIGGEFLAAAPAAVLALRIVMNQFVADLLVSINVGYIGAGDDADMRVGVALADGAQGGQGHDGVADPVGGANHDFHIRSHPALLTSSPELSEQAKSRSLTPQKARGFGMTAEWNRTTPGLKPRPPKESWMR